ncbi:hypothetical protein ABK040_013855 [Willaertia magna]
METIITGTICLPFDLSTDFQFIRLLGYNSQQKLIFLLGKIKENDAILIIEKNNFTLDNINDWIKFLNIPNGIGTQKVITNDKYYTMNISCRENNLDFNLLKTTVVWPANEKDIIKYSIEESFLFIETYEMYKNITLQYIENIPEIENLWIDNLLSKKSEVEHLIYEDTESDEDLRFMLHPDLKFDKTDINQLYCLAFTFDSKIRSLRDLCNERHLLLLKNIRDRGSKEIEKIFGVPKEKLRIYVHYLPSFYRFHVHFNHINYLGISHCVERAYLLDDIIDNMETFGLDFYQKKSLHVLLRKSHPLTKQFLNPSQ